MASVPDIFGRPLQVDPAVALKPFAVAPPVDGPAHRAQFVVELVGPRTVPADAAKVVLDPRWKAALGEPTVYIMAATDETWRALEGSDRSNSYDSIALAWEYVTARGALSAATARNLLNVAEQLAQPLGRKAMPMPPPEDVDAAVRAVEEASQALDVGVGLTVLPRRDPFPEKEVWLACAALGLQVGPSGLFEWSVPGWPEPVLSLSSLGDKETFSLQAVTIGATHPGLSVGFRVARSPAPEAALDACIRIARYLESNLNAVAFDDEDRQLTDAVVIELADNLAQATSAMRRARLEPGSAAALRIFR